MILLTLLVSWLGLECIALVAVGLISYYLFKFYRKVSKFPKGPFPLPFIGNAHQITPYHLHEDFERFSKDYGDVFTIFLFGQPLVVLMRSDAIKEAIVVQGEKFVNRTGEFPEDVFQVVENGGIIFSSGDNWREQRRNALHILRDFGVGRNLMEDQVHTQLEEFMENIKNLKDKERVDLNTPIQIVVSNVINKLLFGYSYPHNDSDRLVSYALTINNLFSDMFKSILIVVCQVFPVVKKIPFIYQRAVGRHVDKMNWCLDFVKEDVKNCLKDYSKDDEPICFAQAYYQKMDDNEFLNMENLYNVCADFFMAGMETTSHTLRWAMLYLAASPEMQEKLRNEIEQVCGRRLPSLKDKPKMPYTNAFLAELQRACNLIPFNLQRKNTEDAVIQGKLIPAGTCVVPQIHSIMSDPKLFPEPEKVKPERFLNQDGSFNTDLVSNVVPFGLGKRQCAGESLAKAELFLGVITFFQKYRISVADGQEINLEPNYGTALQPKPHLYKLEEVN